ncbi:DUF1330 domain-containing protein [Brachybacterium sp. FME24]|uniref:DUF1330 domain-containing protein n=1 Tax=Brachybacterium sp. FME24 TaxID=2742605 RepID=UPI001867CB26|nr:DUF1330 domain-containing protein [Brachybacterium sp. FME24]
MDDITTTRSYAVGLLSRVSMGEDIIEYLRRIDATLAPFAGRFLIHGSSALEKENTWPEDLIVIEFPTSTAAAAWYDSAAYQEIISLRTANAEGTVALFAGVEHPHRATDVIPGPRSAEPSPRSSSGATPQS